MRKIFLSLICAAMFWSSPAAEPFTVKLYPDGAPQSNGLSGDAKVSKEGYITNISDPVLTVFLPEKSRANGQVVVICPGGGYRFVSSVNEGRDVAAWMNEQGIAAVELDYRLPNGHHEVPLTDALAAIEYVRRNAPAWGCDTAQVGIIGFSAGGHLAASASTLYTSPANRPDFSILVYAVITMDERYTHGTRYTLVGERYNAELVNRYSTEKHIDAQTPPAFLALCSDDRTVSPINSILYYEGLLENKVPAELHIYPKGGHGWGFTPGRFACQQEMFASLSRWLSSLRK